MNKAFVIGQPIKHSKSPILHGFWLKKYDLNGHYESVEIAPHSLENFLKTFSQDGYIGGNITIPHKEEALKFIQKIDATAELIGATNTVWIEDGLICGTNTDSYGFSANLDDYTPEWRNGKKAVVLGAGGASRAVIHAILEAGYRSIEIVNRTYARAETLAFRFGDKCTAQPWQALQELLSDCDLLVNTTSLGMKGTEISSDTPMPDLTALQKTAIVTDIVYTPLQTPILKAADQCNLKAVDGLGMLLHQAVPGFEKWFGQKPEVTNELRQKILEVS